MKICEGKKKRKTLVKEISGKWRKRKGDRKYIGIKERMGKVLDMRRMVTKKIE